MKRTFTVTLELETEAPADPLYHRNRPTMDLGPDAIYVQLNGLLETSDNLRVSHVAEINPDLEMPRMLVLSTAHITSETNQRLHAKVRDLLAMSERAELPVAFEKGDYGYVLALIGEDEDRERWATIPDLAAIRAVAEAAGCTWIMLDQDGDTVEGLPTYSW